MINLMLVAGDKTNKLSSFLKNRGTFQIDFSFQSFSADLNKIRDSIINVDKLVYILDRPDFNVRTEMQILKELLSTDGFFTVQEILFIVTEFDEKKQALQYFNAVMDSCSFSKYKIIHANSKLTFADIFDYIIGISQVNNSDNTFKDVYRVERYSEATVAYVGTDDTNLIVEPFDYERLNTYEAAKGFAKKAESGIAHNDADTGSNITQIDKPDLGIIELVDGIKELQTIVVTGERKTGISTWSAAVASSSIAAGKDVLLLDFTANCDLSDILTMEKVPFVNVSMTEMLHNYKLSEHCINLLCASKSNEKAVISEFLQFLYSNRAFTATVIIALQESLFLEISSIIENDIYKILYCINPIFSDVVSKQMVLQVLSEYKNLNIVLNNRVKVMNEQILVDKELLLELLPFDLKVIQSIDFEALDLDASLYNSLMEV